MVDDDDPKLSVPAPAGAPADEPEPEADTEPEGEQQPEGDDAETKPPADEEAVGEDDEQDDDDEDEDEGDDDKSRKSSRNARYKRKAEHLAAQLEAERSRSSGSIVPPDQAALQRAFQQRVHEEIGDPPDPNDPKYKDNYVRFERETQAWLNDERTVTREVRREFIGNIQREQERIAEKVADHKERVARLRTKVPNFDAVMAKATVPVAPHVEQLILDSKRSDRVMWHLAHDQSKLVKLNNLSPVAAAREIGRIEGRLSLPQPKAQTQARKPITPLRGGGTSPPSQLAEVNAYIKKQYGDKA